MSEGGLPARGKLYQKENSRLSCPHDIAANAILDAVYEILIHVNKSGKRWRNSTHAVYYDTEADFLIITYTRINVKPSLI